MKKVALQFDNIMLLTDFLGVIEVATCEINRRALVVICEISEADIKLAIHGFGRLFSKNENSCENKGRPKLTAYVKQAQNTLKTRRDVSHSLFTLTPGFGVYRIAMSEPFSIFGFSSSKLAFIQTTTNACTKPHIMRFDTCYFLRQKLEPKILSSTASLLIRLIGIFCVPIMIPSASMLSIF